ncbi:MAG: sodium-dependent transporter, partial [Bacteroidetes bacterium]
MATSNRGQWSGKLGFILAASGSAIGLGNIWRFPYTAGENGGGAFVLLYLMFVVVIGIPLVLAELSVGRKTQLNPVGAFEKLSPGSKWPWLGKLGILTGFGILAFYSVIAGWTLWYLFEAITGGFSGEITPEVSLQMFESMTSDPWLAIFLMGVFLILTIVI